MSMRYTPSDFLVEELIQFPDEPGAYSYYRVEKHNTTTETVRQALAKRFKVTPSSIIFPALRDFSTKVVQYVSVREPGPEQVEGQGFVAHRVRHGSRALRAKDLQGNHFTIKLRHLTKAQAKVLRNTLGQLELYGLPNYFGAQRFRSMTEDGFIGKAILMHDAEKAIRFYLAEPILGDSEQVREFKALVKSHWGQWGYLLHQAPRPSNYRSVLVYLKDHSRDYEKAANIIRDKRLAIYLLTYQSWVWNHILAHYLQQSNVVTSSVDIANGRLPLLDLSQHRDVLQGLMIELPRLTAYYQGDVATAAEAALADEELTLRDFNVRLIRRVCFAKGERAAWFAPTDVRIGEPVVDQHKPEAWSVTVSFALPLQHYATVVLKAASVYMGASLNE